MAVKKVQMIPPGYTDVVHPETDSSMVLMGDGSTLESKLADYIRHPAYGATGGTANVYTFASTPALPALADGVSAYLDINVANTGASTLNWDNTGAKAIVDSKGNALTPSKLKANIIIGVRYNASASNFQLLGEGGEGTASASDILSGKTATVDSGLVTGTMTDNGSKSFIPSTSLQTSGSGYYSSISVSAVTSSIDSDIIAGNIKHGVNILGVIGTYDDEATNPITASDVLTGHIGFVNGVKVTGTMANNASPTTTITSHGGTATVPLGYNPGGTVTASYTNFSASVIQKGAVVGGVTGTYDTEATNPISAGYVRSGKIGWVNGAKVTGSLVVQSTTTQTVTPTTTDIIKSAGIYDGAITISGDPDLVTSNIKSGVNIFGVAGKASVVETSDATALVDEIVMSKTAYVNGSKLTGTVDKQALIDIANEAEANVTALKTEIANAIGSPALSTDSIPILSGYVLNNRLLMDNIPNAVQTPTYSGDGSISQIIQAIGGVTVRTDTFTYLTNQISELRTLSTGEHLTLQYYFNADGSYNRTEVI